MPVINRQELMNAEAKVGGSGGIEQMEPGVYLLRIQAIRTKWTKADGTVTDGMEKKCVRIVWDVAEGQFADKYKDAYFVDWDGNPDPDKDFMHSCYLSWNKLEYFKHNIAVLDACNADQNFDSLTAFENDRWDMFVGKKFYAVVNGEVDLNDNGYDRWKLDVGAWLTPQMVQSGEFPEPKVTDNRGKKKGGGSSTGASTALGATYAV